MITETSRAALSNMGGARITKAQTLLRAYLRASRAVSDREVRDFLKWEVNQVCGRRNDLMKKGLVRHAGFKKCQYTGELVRVYSVPNEIKNKLTGA